MLDRTWRDGDRVELRLPMRLHAHPMPDDPTVQPFMYGPLVLAGALGRDGLTAPADDLACWVKPVPGRPLEFRTTGQERGVVLVPRNAILDERYAVYWKVRGP